MFDAYKVVEDTQEHTIYQYNSFLSWVQFPIIAAAIIGIVDNILYLQVLCGIAILAYIYIGKIRASAVNKELKAALQAGSFKMEGNRYSFTSPLRYHLFKQKSDQN